MANSQPFTVACEGGLIKSTNSLALLRTPGFATKLRNFEVGTEGGYRRVSGFTRFGGDDAVNPNWWVDVNVMLGKTEKLTKEQQALGVFRKINEETERTGVS